MDKKNKLVGLITFRDIIKLTLKPIANKDDLVYYLSMQDLLSIVQTFTSGKYHFDKIIFLSFKENAIKKV